MKKVRVLLFCFMILFTFGCQRENVSQSESVLQMLPEPEPEVSVIEPERLYIVSVPNWNLSNEYTKSSFVVERNIEVLNKGILIVAKHHHITSVVPVSRNWYRSNPTGALIVFVEPKK